MIDKDSLNWSSKLLLVGVASIALWEILDGIHPALRIFGNMLIVGSLLFLVDFQGGPRFRRLYWPVLTFWLIIALHSLAGFIKFSESGRAIFRTIVFFNYSVSLVSVYLFGWAMFEFCQKVELTSLATTWKKITNATGFFYLIPFLAFFSAFIGSLVGGEIEFFTGITDPNAKLASLWPYALRILFFVPPTLVVLMFFKTNKQINSVAP
jgi:hypothetical protein